MMSLYDEHDMNDDNEVSIPSTRGATWVGHGGLCSCWSLQLITWHPSDSVLTCLDHRKLIRIGLHHSPL